LRPLKAGPGCPDTLTSMGAMNTTEKNRGHYMGTEINQKWWRRCTDEGLLARGMGVYWLDPESLNFLRHLTSKPIQIPFSSISEVKTGKWHSGQWAGGATVVKVIWTRDGKSLGSGFVFSRDDMKTGEAIRQIRSRISG